MIPKNSDCGTWATCAPGPEMVDRLDWPADRLARHRTAELRALLRVAVDRSPWHRRRLAGIDIDRTRRDDRSVELPVMTKDDLMEHFDEIVTDDRLTLEVVEAHLEGLTGDAYLLDRYHVMRLGRLQRPAGRVRLRLGRLGRLLPGHHAQRAPGPRADHRAGGGSRCWPRWPPDARRTHRRALSPGRSRAPHLDLPPVPRHPPMDEIVAGLNKVQPTILRGYPSALFASGRGGAGRAACGSAPGASWPAASRSCPRSGRPSRRPGASRSCNVWGTSEAGRLAMACGRPRASHLSEDLTIVEPVDAGAARSGRANGRPRSC